MAPPKTFWGALCHSTPYGWQRVRWCIVIRSPGAAGVGWPYTILQTTWRPLSWPPGTSCSGHRARSVLAIPCPLPWPPGAFYPCHSAPSVHWRILGGGTIRPCPQSPGRGTIMSFAPPPKKKSSHKTFFYFFLKMTLGPSKKRVGWIRGVFSFGGILGWDPAPSCPPPLNRRGGWIRQWLCPDHSTPCVLTTRRPLSGSSGALCPGHLANFVLATRRPVSRQPRTLWTGHQALSVLATHRPFPRQPGQPRQPVFWPDNRALSVLITRRFLSLYHGAICPGKPAPSAVATRRLFNLSWPSDALCLKGRVPPFWHKTVFTRATTSQCDPVVHFPIFVSGNA